MSIRVRAERDPLRCPYCHAELEGRGPVADCAACGAQQHAGCRDEHGRCASCGGAGGARPRSAGPPRTVDPRAGAPPGPTTVVLPGDGAGPPRAGRAPRPAWLARGRPDRVRVEVVPGGARLAWGLVGLGEWVALAVLALLFLPLAALVVVSMWRARRGGGLALEPLALSGLFSGFAGLPRARTLAREQVRGAHLRGDGALVVETVDGELVVATEVAVAALPWSDRHWLAETLRAWAAEGRGAQATAGATPGAGPPGARGRVEGASRRRATPPRRGRRRRRHGRR